MKYTKYLRKLYSRRGIPYSITAKRGDIDICYFQFSDLSIKEQRANAKLITASPKLLKALTNLLSKCPLTLDSRTERDAAHALIDKLNT